MKIIDILQRAYNSKDYLNLEKLGHSCGHWSTMHSASGALIYLSNGLL